MRTVLLQVSLLVGTLSFVPVAANGQEIVHAIAGKVTAVNPASKTITIRTDDGSEGLFYVQLKTNTPMIFPKNVKALTTPAATFTKADAPVVVFYIGDDKIRTSVALEDLGAAPLVKSMGTVVRFDKHAHELTIQNSKGTEETFHIDGKTVAEGFSGVCPGDKLDADKGMKVRVTSISDNGTETALFIRAVSL